MRFTHDRIELVLYVLMMTQLRRPPGGAHSSDWFSSLSVVVREVEGI